MRTRFSVCSHGLGGASSLGGGREEGRETMRVVAFLRSWPFARQSKGLY